MRRLLVVGVLAAVMLLPLAASAHVTVSADNPAPGSFTVYTVRVPNESDGAATVRVEVQLPESLATGRYQPKSGWNLSVEDGVFVAEGGSIAVGEFDEFYLQGRNPEDETTLVFPAIQVYDDGEEVAWTGEAESDTPASRLEITASSAGEGESGPLVLAALILGAVGTLLGGVALFRK